MPILQYAKVFGNQMGWRETAKASIGQKSLLKLQSWVDAIYLTESFEPFLVSSQSIQIKHFAYLKHSMGNGSTYEQKGN
jgi:hypothetical protein